jgi:hypothetical protein
MAVDPNEVKISASDIGAIVGSMLPLLTVLGAGIWKVTKYLIDTSRDFLEKHINSRSKEVDARLRSIENVQTAIVARLSEVQETTRKSFELSAKTADALRDIKIDLITELNEQTKAQIDPLRSEVIVLNDFFVKVRTALQNKKGSGQ